MRARRTHFAIATAGLGLALSASEAAAQQPPKITKSDYGLDLFQGPVTTASRVIGVAGAYGALAEWCEGEYSNAASPAVRAPYSLGTWDFDLCLGITNPGAFSGNDFENRGAGFAALPTRFSNSVTYNLGLQVQYRTMGVTLDYDEIRLGLRQNVNVTQAQDNVVIDRVSGSVANAFLDDQLLVGVGFRAVKLSLDETGSFADRVTSFSFVSGGVAPQVGAIIKPRGLPFRIGVTLRSEISVSDIHGTSQLPDGSQVLDGKILPSHIVLPSEVEIGAAYELGKRPLNPRRIDIGSAEDAIRVRYDSKRLERAADYEARIRAAPENQRERLRRSLELEELRIESGEDADIRRQVEALERAQAALSRLWDRQQIMLLAGVLVTGPTPDSVGISDFLTQQQVTSGRSVVVSPRLAVETEAVPRWVTVRGGGYLEPPRYAASSPREHFTAGVDVRLFAFNPFGLLGDTPWRLRLGADLAPRYFNWAVALGKYH